MILIISIDFEMIIIHIPFQNKSDLTKEIYFDFLLIKYISEMYYNEYLVCNSVFSNVVTYQMLVSK